MFVCSIACWSNLKRFLSVLFVFGSDFCHGSKEKAKREREKTTRGG